MIAVSKPPRLRSVPAWHAHFMALVPAITQRANFSFRKLRPELRQELVQEVLANCLVAFHQLVKLDKTNLAFPSALTRYAIGQIRRGRRIGSGFNRRDVLSRYVQTHRGVVVERLDQFDRQAGGWQEILVEDRRATPADTAVSRLDFQAWLLRLSGPQRRLVKLLASGERACAIARRLQMSEGRISQLRRKLHASWNDFQGPAVGSAE